MRSTGRIVIAALALLCSGVQAQRPRSIRNLQVEYQNTPLGIDVRQPRFSWQMEASAGERGLAQSAYRIEVRDPKGTVVWDSGRTDGPESLAIKYGGSALGAATRYSWTVTVWTQAGAQLRASSWFETGLLDPAPGSAAWGGAKWIGGGSEDLVLYCALPGDLRCHVRGDDRPGQHPREFRLRRERLPADGQEQEHLPAREREGPELHQARVRRLGRRWLSGGQGEAPRLPRRLRSDRYPGAAAAHVRDRHIRHQRRQQERGARRRVPQRIRADHDLHRREILVGSRCGSAGSRKSGRGAAPGRRPGRGRGTERADSVNLNPMGSGGDYLPFGLLCDVGFSVDPGQSASFRDVTIRNNRAPNNILFKRETSRLRPTPESSPMPSPAFRLLGGKRAVRPGGRRERRVRRPESQPQLRADAPHRVQGGRQADRRRPSVL